MVFLVKEQAGCRPRSGVDVLVGAPHREIDVPVVEAEWDVAGRVGEVPAYAGDAEGVGVGGDGFDVEELAGVVLDSGEEDESGGGGVLGYGGEDGFGGEVEVGGGLDFDEGGGGGEVVVADLGLDGVLCGVRSPEKGRMGGRRHTQSEGKGFHSMMTLCLSAVGL